MTSTLQLRDSYVTSTLHLRYSLPNSIAAFFYPVAATETERDVVREQHRKFLDTYRLDKGFAPPLLELDLSQSPPFRLPNP